MTFAACPSKWIRGWRSEDTDATEWGTLMDILTLAHERADDLIAVRPEEYPSEKGNKPWSGRKSHWCAKWLDDHAAFLVVKNSERAAAYDALKRMEEHPEIYEFLECSDRQVMATSVWNDKETGVQVPVKILVDLVPFKDHENFGKCLGDLKTSRSAAARDYDRSVFSFGYHVQAALYLDVYCAATGEDRCTFQHVVSENTPPYEPECVLIDSEFIELGRCQYQLALKFYAKCLQEKRWPGYEGLDQSGRRRIHGWRVASPQSWMVSA